MKRPRALPIALACLISFGAGASAMWAQQQQAGSTTRREPQLENDRVRVWKSIIVPNSPLTIHRHDHARVLIALNGGQLKVMDKAGKLIDTYNWEPGKAYWLKADPPGQMHADRNEMTRPIEVIVVELKDNGK
jgi:beta-alanine degradation protein BauB